MTKNYFLQVRICRKVVIKMSVFRVEKTKNYTVMSNYHLKDKKLSLEARGLLSVMLSLRDDWDYSLSGLVKISNAGIKKVRNVLNELKKYGYLIIEKKKGNNGRFEYEYFIYEVPYTLKGDVEEGEMVEGIQLNTNKESINNKDKLDKSLNVLTKELIKRKFINKDDIELYSYDSFFNTLLTKYNFKKCVIVISYVISKIKGKDSINDKYIYFKTSVLNNIEKIDNNDLPSWFNKDITIKELTHEEKEEYERLFSDLDNN